MSECEHENHKYKYLRSEYRKNSTQRVDIYYCKKCLEYKEKIVWESPRGF